MSAPRALAQLWKEAQLPQQALLTRIKLTGDDPLPSSFRLGDAAQATIGCAALAASELLSHRSPTTSAPTVTLSVEDAACEFRSEQLGTLDGKAGKVWDELVGQYKALGGGWCRPHTNWQHHKEGLLKLVGLPLNAGKADFAQVIASLDADELAEKAMSQGLVLTALRSFDEWDAHTQGQAAAARTGGPLAIAKVSSRPPKPFRPLTTRRPLEGVRVLDLTRVIAGPTAGRTLAAYGADVLWITAPHLPSLPGLDADTSRGKRTTQLDLRRSCPNDRATFVDLVKDADVLLQAYRPDGLASLGFAHEDLLAINPDLVYASLSAWGEDGPWKDRKGFDSLVQFAVGINEAEGRAFAEFKGTADESLLPRPLPCQALDHGAGYLLAFGIEAALLRRASEGGAFKVETSLLSTATWLRSLGRKPSSSFELQLETNVELKERDGMGQLRGFGGGELEFVQHAAKFDGAEVGWRSAPEGLSSNTPTWKD